ncbi:oligosaccharide flippase family protein [Paracoccus sp. 1_MG-2023]|uniref:oligosaccharide flippase family protein n=1 Tax=unclassified Paracoccus (in: a-proteobacteria) TaxID=2688777 RepID=UPI001C098D10|nr:MULTISPECIES: oligosaccharide flippase family protein [unclassified Paracoccus (in: a-proteobacteria)]MBU2956522.1 oligosaccharide flippase family protein [Paracoccus sp. C2R09]MDO6670441.1 oligosaccharide flippase family protein [Paracoccus sp. 1_MG-2023]
MRSTSGRGASWTTFGFVASYGIRLLSTLILTRLLAPDVFGLMSLAWVFIGAVGMLSDIGTIPSVIRSPRGDEKVFLDTAWSVQTVRGLWIGGLTALIAWPVSRLYDEPQLFPILCTVAVMPILSGMNSMAGATCRRHMQLKKLTLLSMSVQILTTLSNVFFAWWLQSVWSLVLGSISGVLFNLLLSYTWLPRYRPRLIFDRSVITEIVNFGRWILLGTLFTYLGGKGSTAIMGLEVSVETLGRITIATTIAWALGDLVARVLDQVAFPTMSRLHREGKPLNRPVGKVKKLSLFGILPCFLLLSFISQPLVDLLYDPRYAQAGSFLSILALNGAIAIMSMPYQNAMLAAGNSRGHSIVMGVFSTSRILLMVLGAHFFGIYGLLTGLGLGELITAGVSIAMSRRSGIVMLRYDLATVAIIIPAYVYALMTAQPLSA